ncbi:hypothetical protein [Paenibacillus elgii]|uniref:hypothetical protein n=1 Tax=Paenibacillus elgii TaxID=189691 RepID=UPI0013D598EF|nr:hypothetical protein [Paenibacillus elgii]
MQEAISKIQGEMDADQKNHYIQYIGKFLLEHLASNPDDAVKILTEGKTIGKSLDEMRKAAEKKKVGNCAVLSDAEGFGIVLKYFGISGTPAEGKKAPIMPAAASSDFDVKLDDFL